MTIFASPHPPLTYPTNLTVWEWLFEPSLSAASPFHHGSSPPTRTEGEGEGEEGLGAYINAANKDETLSFDMVRQHAIHLSHVFYNLYGIRAGDAVTLFSTNTVWYPVVMWAVLRLGGRVNGASPAYTMQEMAHAMKTAKTKLVFTLASSVSTVHEAAETVGLKREKVLLLDSPIGEDSSSSTVVSLQDLLKKGRPGVGEEVPHWRIPNGQTNKQVCGFLNFSSGTTGLPKAVMLSHHNIIAQCMQLRQLQVLPGDDDPPQEDIPKNKKNKKKYSVLAVMPLFHITGLVRFCTYPLFMNGYCYMLPRYTLEGMLDAICAYQIEELILVPPILIRLVKDLDGINAARVKNGSQKYDLRHVKRWSCGSAPIAPEVIKALQAKFPWTGFRQGYGATESTACITCHPPTHFDFKYATAGGMLVANTEAKVLSLEDEGEGNHTTGKKRRELGVGETGEICARGPQIAMGYLDNEAATRETFWPGGWLHTGDVGHFDAQGLIHIEDRIKEMIKVKGLQVPPAELEDLLLGHELVEDCAVTGVKDESGTAGERPKAFVVLKAGVPKNEETGRMLLDFVKLNKVRYKWLVEVEFIDEVPKNPTGKLLRRMLKLREKDGRVSRGLRVRDTERARL